MTPFLAILAFLCGSFPSGLVLGKLILGQDIRRGGSGNIGAANVARQAGFKVGVLTAVLDALKGLIPVLIARGVGMDTRGLALVALAAVLGHDFSIFLRFRGGKGVATTVGVMLALAPPAALLSIAVFVVVFLLSSYASLASLGALALLPLFLVLTHGPQIYVPLATVLFFLAVWKHRANISRLIQGTEQGFRDRDR